MRLENKTICYKVQANFLLLLLSRSLSRSLSAIYLCYITMDGIQYTHLTSCKMKWHAAICTWQWISRAWSVFELTYYNKGINEIFGCSFAKCSQSFCLLACFMSLLVSREVVAHIESRNVYLCMWLESPENWTRHK